MPLSTPRANEYPASLHPANTGKETGAKQAIKVVHVANIDVGLKIHLGNYMRYQREQGYVVSAITHPGRWLQEDTTILDGIAVKIIPFRPRLSPWADLRALARLCAYFRKQQFDIVHTHTVKPGLIGRLAAKLTGVPVVVHTVHGFFFYEGMASTQYRLYTAIEKLGVMCSDLLLSQNRQDMETAYRAHICSPDKMRYLGNGIDLSRFDRSRLAPGRLTALRAELGIQLGQPVIGFVARLEREKGVVEFVQAASLLKAQGITARFLVIGAVPSEKSSAVDPKQLIHAYGLAHDTVLLGHRDDIPELLALMDVVTLPSYGREGIPRILMESAAMGVPVVATRVRGVVETVEEGVTGLLVPPWDAPALAKAFAQLLLNPSYAAELGYMARQHALRCFDERAFFRRTDIEYRRLIQAKLGFDPGVLLRPIPSQ